MNEMNMKILVPVDFTSNTDKLVDYSMYLAERLNAEVRYLHVVESFSKYSMILVHPSFD